MSLRPQDRRAEDLDFLKPQEARRYQLTFRFDEAGRQQSSFSGQKQRMGT